MPSYPPNTLNLVADVGGTNTRVALAKGTKVLSETVRRYANAEFPGLESVLRKYITEMDNVDCAGACVAVAGPVRNGVGTMTNLDWTFDHGILSRSTRAETVAVINDLEAQGHALGFIHDTKVRKVLDGDTNSPDDAKLVIGVGTGFNAAPVHETRKGRYVSPSECGHANMPIRTELELELCHFIETLHGFPAVEDVLSGRGVERLYHFFSAREGEPIEKAAADVMAAVATGNDPIADHAAQMFVRMLGRVAGNLALYQLPFGGIYLVGGVARAFTPYLERFGFGSAFRDKGRFAGFMQNFPIYVVEDDFAALTGCASHLRQLCNQD